eukprot:13934988-Ditylum_brightwellii.AAC.2
MASVYEIGQGSTNRPPGWTLISTIILKVYHRMCKGCAITNPAQKMKIQCNTDIFVDNATLLHNNGNKFNTPAQQLMNHIQHNAEIWGQLLWVTGGSLDIRKTIHYPGRGTPPKQSHSH